MTRLERPPRRARGAVMAEYILMAGLIAIVAMAAAMELGPIVTARLQGATSALAGGGPSQGGDNSTLAQ